MRTSKIYCLSNFQICNNTVLIIVVTILYITSHDVYFISGSLHLLTPFTHFTSSHLWQPICSLYFWAFVSMSFFFFFLKIPCINEIIRYMSFSPLFQLVQCSWDHSYCCKWQHLILFLWLSSYSSVCVWGHIFFIHSSIDRLTDCFLVLAIVNNASVNMRMQMFLN